MDSVETTTIIDLIIAQGGLYWAIYASLWALVLFVAFLAYRRCK